MPPTPPEPITHPKLVAVDLDGTFLSDSKTISEANKACYHALNEMGVTVALASGRMVPRMLDFERSLGLSCHIVGYNGSVCLPPHEDGNHGEHREPIFAKTLPIESLNALLEYCKEADVIMGTYLKDGIYVPNHPRTAAIIHDFKELTGNSCTVSDTYDVLKNSHAYKTLIWCASEEEQDKVYNDIAARKLDIHQVKTECHSTELIQRFVEFLAPGCNKGWALERLCDRLGVDPGHAVCIGDGDNDIEMIRTAGHGISLANGSQELKDVADHISSWSNEEDGVARELVRIVPTIHPILKEKGINHL